MQALSTPITGLEPIENDDTPLSALFEFYSAFNHRNLALMQENWLASEEASMSNPLGGIKRGWNEVKSVYEKIFNGPAEVYVEFRDYTIHQSDDMFIAVGRETGTLHINSKTIELAIRTSRIYRRHRTSWKQLHHHGSMDNPELLAHYQKTILQ